jgi:hypothetical protein
LSRANPRRDARRLTFCISFLNCRKSTSRTSAGKSFRQIQIARQRSAVSAFDSPASRRRLRLCVMFGRMAARRFVFFLPLACGWRLSLTTNEDAMSMSDDVWKPRRPLDLLKEQLAAAEATFDYVLAEWVKEGEAAFQRGLIAGFPANLYSTMARILTLRRAVEIVSASTA